jgi:predicted RNase H-like nuclease (RuvC/YqgF family)
MFFGLTDTTPITSSTIGVRRYREAKTSRDIESSLSDTTSQHEYLTTSLNTYLSQLEQLQSSTSTPTSVSTHVNDEANGIPRSVAKKAAAGKGKKVSGDIINEPSNEVKIKQLETDIKSLRTKMAKNDTKRKELENNLADSRVQWRCSNGHWLAFQHDTPVSFCTAYFTQLIEIGWFDLID